MSYPPLAWPPALGPPRPQAHVTAADFAVRVDGLPVHFSETDWEIHKAAPTLGADNDYVFGEILGLSEAEIGRLRDEAVI